MKKKLLSILLCAAMLASLPALGGCKSKAPPTQPASQSQAQKPAEVLSVVTMPDPARREEVSAAALGFAAEQIGRAHV